MPFTLPWTKKQDDDPYWDAFTNRPPADPNALALFEMLRSAPDGNVYPVQSEVHSPDIMAQHLKGLASFFGADVVGILRLAGNTAPAGREPDAPTEYPFGILVGVRAEHDPSTAAGMGGQTPVLKGAGVTFNLGAYIRECGYHATRTQAGGLDRLAAACGLGTLNGAGRLVTAAFGDGIHLADVVLTDLPLAPDGEEAAPWPPTS